MSPNTYLWIEDRVGKAGYTFWKTLMQQILPNVAVESKKNNSELVKAVKTLKDQDSKYIIVFDNAFDNPQVYQEQRRLKKYAETKKNVSLINIICFEYVLLEFAQLIDWIYAPEDEFLIKRVKAIQARKKLIEAIQTENLNYKTIQEIVTYDSRFNEHNIEKLSAKLLYDLTRNTGFEVSKGTIGECWIKSCCEWLKRQENDICGLDSRRLSIAEKMRKIYSGTSLKEKFHEMGLEAAQ